MKLGRFEGMANDNGHLGSIFKTLSDADEALELWSKARDLFAQIGMPREGERRQRLLDGLPDVANGGS